MDKFSLWSKSLYVFLIKVPQERRRLKKLYLSAISIATNENNSINQSYVKKFKMNFLRNVLFIKTPVSYPIN